MKVLLPYLLSLVIIVNTALWLKSSSSEAFTIPPTSQVRFQPHLRRVPHYHQTNFYASVVEQQTQGIQNEQQQSTILESTASKIVLRKPIPYSDLTIGVLKETFPGENRVSQTPDSVSTLVIAGFNVVVQAGGVFCIKSIPYTDSSHVQLTSL